MIVGGEWSGGGGHTTSLLITPPPCNIPSPSMGVTSTPRRRRTVALLASLACLVSFLCNSAIRRRCERNLVNGGHSTRKSSNIRRRKLSLLDPKTVEIKAVAFPPRDDAEASGGPERVMHQAEPEWDEVPVAADGYREAAQQMEDQILQDWVGVNPIEQQESAQMDAVNQPSDGQQLISPTANALQEVSPTGANLDAGVQPPIDQQETAEIDAVNQQSDGQQLISPTANVPQEVSPTGANIDTGAEQISTSDSTANAVDPQLEDQLDMQLREKVSAQNNDNPDNVQAEIGGAARDTILHDFNAQLEEDLNAALGISAPLLDENVELLPGSDVATPRLAARTPRKVNRYSISDAIRAAKAFHYTLFFFLYDSDHDRFVVIHNVDGCGHGCVRVYGAANFLSHALRLNFPDRFAGDVSDDLVMLLSVGSAPRLQQHCVLPESGYCGSGTFAPIMQFGSVFVSDAYLPSMVAMPMTVQPHLPCLEQFREKGTACSEMNFAYSETTSIVRRGGDRYWEDLIPTIVWRGTDVNMLDELLFEMKRPSYDEDLLPYESEGENNEVWAIQRLWEMGHKRLSPRWRGVILSSLAALEALELEELQGAEAGPVRPWIDVKFTHNFEGGKKIKVKNNKEYTRLSKVHIYATGKAMGRSDLAKYKYREFSSLSSRYIFAFSPRPLLTNDPTTLILLSNQISTSGAPVAHRGRRPSRRWPCPACSSTTRRPRRSGTTTSSHPGFTTSRWRSTCRTCVRSTTGPRRTPSRPRPSPRRGRSSPGGSEVGRGWSTHTISSSSSPCATSSKRTRRCRRPRV